MVSPGNGLVEGRCSCRARGGVGSGSKNVAFVQIDLSEFDRDAEPESFDIITTFDAIHDQGKPLNVLKGIHCALKSDGVYLMQEIKGSSHVHKNLEHPLGTTRSPACTA